MSVIGVGNRDVLAVMQDPHPLGCEICTVHGMRSQRMPGLLVGDRDFVAAGTSAALTSAREDVRRSVAHASETLNEQKEQP